MHGRKGEDQIIFVPLGSMIKDAEDDHILADLIYEGDRFVAAAGGKGGGGNVHYATAQNRTPRNAGKGTPGEERWLKIELKLLADVGLIGLPNAGKSTLLSKLSAANPKVAAYPFTTLEPKLGILQLEYREPCIIADIPGIIEGAHEGAGLGHKFLRHVERTKILLHVLDAGSSYGDPLADFRTLENELSLYKDELLQRKRLIVLNKIDLLEDPEALAHLLEKASELGHDIISISALQGEGISALKEKIGEIMDEISDL
jgi:GTP-binding protein